MTQAQSDAGTLQREIETILARPPRDTYSLARSYLALFGALQALQASVKAMRPHVRELLVDPYDNVTTSLNSLESIINSVAGTQDSLVFTMKVGPALALAITLQNQLEAMEELRFEHSNMRR